MNKMIYKKNTEIKNLIMRIEALRSRIDALRPFDYEVSRILQEKFRIEWTYNSNAIEGNTLTYGETAFFLKEGLTSEGKPLKDFLEAKNHAEAIDGIYEIIRNKRKMTEGLIKELHGLLLRGIEFTFARGADGSMIKKPLHPGMYKVQPNHVLTLSGKIHYYTDPLHVKDEMEKLVKWLYTEKKLHIAEKPAIFHYRFAAIHPFDDGNGRMARLLMNLLFIKEGYPPCVIKNVHRREYLEALNKADETGDYSPFVKFVLTELEETMKMMFEIVSGKEKIESKETAAGRTNSEQRHGLILDVLGVSGESFSIGRIHEKIPQIKRPTLKSDLKELLRKKQIKRKGKGKGAVYYAIAG